MLFLQKGGRTTLFYKKSRFNELSLNQDFYETVFMNKCIYNENFIHKKAIFLYNFIN